MPINQADLQLTGEKMTILEQTANSEKTGKVPIWFMRQAGRYLPEYMALKEGRDFMELVMDPDLASEITLQPVKRYDLDAAIIFSDILVILHALDMGVSFKTGAPEIEKNLESDGQLDKIIADYDKDKLRERLDFYRVAIEKTRQGLAQEKSLIGFAAAPFTLASYMIEGKTSKTHAKTRAWMYQHKDSFSKLTSFIAKSTVDYLNLQIDAGVNMVQIFDSWGDAMDTQTYRNEIFPSIKEIVNGVKDRTKVIFFCKGASIHRDTLSELYDSGVSVLSIDWRLPIEYFGDKPVQGNLDPATLLTNPETVAARTGEILAKRGNKPGFTFNLGHGIYPETPLENVQAMVETVQRFKPSY